MKKVTLFIISVLLCFYINACTGYTPIYNSANFNFKIKDHSLRGEERLAKLIYKKLNSISLSNKDDLDVQSISLSIETRKEKKSTVKNNAGKILEYQINLNTNVVINDFLTKKIIFDVFFSLKI